MPRGPRIDALDVFNHARARVGSGGVSPKELLGGSKRHRVSEVRQLLSYAGSRALGISAAQISRTLNVSSQAILQAALKAEQSWEDLDWMMKESKE
jgi:hypothetical protein